MAACAVEGDQAPTVDASSRQLVGEVASVIDGDTIDLDTTVGRTTVRLAAINAPDIGECFFDEATEQLLAGLQRATVSVEVVGTDQFDRSLGHVFAGERHVNRELVASGHALVSGPDQGDPYRAVMLSAEQEAFADRIGLWAGDACGPADVLPEVVIDPGQSEPDPPGPDDTSLGSELMTIVNRAGETIDLSGWRLRDESSRHRFTFAPGTSLEPDESIQVRSDAPGWDPGGTPVWNNEGDTALLLDPAGTIVSRWRY